MIGQNVAHYKISEKIGAGGMGEVYRATDSRLGRDVALKILPEAFARDPDRMARFRREAQVLAQLNHPNIAAVYGLEAEGATAAIVLELVEGPTLEDRLRPGPLPLAEAVPIARQIAEGIEAAHEAGIIHRDLKPANVKLTPQDDAKVLDFGLAKAFDEAPSSSSAPSATVDADSPTMAPTFTSPVTGALTGANVILGTAPYMSPEQARGQALDKRSDIWSFGVLLFEMLTGRRLFAGETVSDTLAAVLKTEPDWSALPVGTPNWLERLLRRCLERDPRRRLRDIGEARILLEEWERAPDSMESPVVAVPNDSHRPHYALWIVAGLALAALAAMWFSRPTPEPGTPVEVSVQLANQARLAPDNGVNVQTSPNGRWLAFRTQEGIEVRRLDGSETRLLPGTAGATQFAFSPEGERIAYTGAGKIRRTRIEDGGAIDVCDLGTLQPRGLAWVNDLTIVFSPTFLGGLKTVSLDTGEIQDLTVVDASANERSHRWPAPLPDGQSVLFACNYHKTDYERGDIRIVRLDERGTSGRTVHREGSFPQYTTSGHLMFARGQAIFAVPLNPKSGETEGTAVPVLNNVWVRVGDVEGDDGSAQYHVSPQGVLIYRSEYTGGLTRIAAVDVAAQELTVLTPTGPIASVLASPDGRSLAYRMGPDLHILNFDSGGSRRLTFGEARIRRGAWSPDSKHFYWQASRDSVRVVGQPIDGTSPVTALHSPIGYGRPTSVSADGQWMLLTEWPEDRGAPHFITHVLNLTDPKAEAQVLLEEPSVGARFSPDGNWVSYRMDDPASRGIYLRRFPDTGARWLLHAAQITSHEWHQDGSAIFVHDELGAGRIDLDLSGESPEISPRATLATTALVPEWSPGGVMTFSPDGSTIYFVQRYAPAGEESEIVMRTRWNETLNELAPR